MRRLCGGFADNELIWDGKIKELKYLLETELKNEQVVVWFNFNSEIRACLDALSNESVAVIRGSTAMDKREEYMNLFNKGEIRILLVQQAVAQTGINLSGADTAIYYSEPTGLLGRKQTEDRILDIKKKQSLLYVNLLVKNTVDTDIRNAMLHKGIKSSMELNRKILENMVERRRNDSYNGN